MYISVFKSRFIVHQENLRHTMFSSFSKGQGKNVSIKVDEIVMLPNLTNF